MRRVFFALLTVLRLTAALAAQPPDVPTLLPKVINVFPHDPTAFTQGLLWRDGHLLESTGLWGESTLRRVELETGEPLDTVAIDEAYFAEGLERVDDRLIQLTWQAGLAFVYDADTLQRVDVLQYDGEGWGLCSDGRYLFMSDGSPYLSIRDRDSFALIFRGAVTLNERLIPPRLLNELECVGDDIYANAWNTDFIFRIDKFSGAVTALIDASSLLTDAERAALPPGAVLNGIAYNPNSMTFYITGKKWPKLFEVIFPSPDE